MRIIDGETHKQLFDVLILFTPEELDIFLGTLEGLFEQPLEGLDESDFVFGWDPVWDTHAHFIGEQSPQGPEVRPVREIELSVYGVTEHEEGRQRHPDMLALLDDKAGEIDDWRTGWQRRRCDGASSGESKNGVG